MHESIVKSARVCFFCGKDDGCEKHHVFFGTANRKLSDEDGLWVWLCSECHRGKHGVHGYAGHDMDVALKKTAEYAWLQHNNKTIQEFIDRYGKNWL